MSHGTPIAVSRRVSLRQSRFAGSSTSMPCRSCRSATSITPRCGKPRQAGSVYSRFAQLSLRIELAIHARNGRLRPRRRRRRQCVRKSGIDVHLPPHRQSRRDRLPGHQDRQAHGHPHHRGLFRCRSRCAACEDGRRGRAYRRLGGARLAISRSTRSSPPASRRAPRRCIRAMASSARTPSFAAALEKHGIIFVGPPVKAIEAMGDKITSQEARRRGRRLDRARPYGADRRCRRSGQDRAPDRLPGDDQGLGRRRRQGHAHRLERRRGARRLRALANPKPRPPSATTASSSRNSSPSRATSKSSCSATSTAMCSSSTSANARSSAATRR